MPGFCARLVGVGLWQGGVEPEQRGAAGHPPPHWLEAFLNSAFLKVCTYACGGSGPWRLCPPPACSPATSLGLAAPPGLPPVPPRSSPSPFLPPLLCPPRHHLSISCRQCPSHFLSPALGHFPWGQSPARGPVCALWAGGVGSWEAAQNTPPSCSTSC